MADRPVVAAFDFDGTITDRDTLVPFLVLAFGRARVAATFAALAFTGVGYLLRRVSIDEFKRRVLRRLVADAPAERLRALGPAHARAIAPWLRPAALARIEWHRAQGHRLVLVSSTLDLYLQPMAAQLGFDDLLCSRLVQLRDVELHVYGDSDGDRELLAAADHPHFRPFRG